MQHDKELREQFSDVFKVVRKILLSYTQIKELKNAKQTWL